MARMPGARWLGEHSPKRRMDRYDVVCVHTIVGYAPAHAAHFSVHLDGTIDQSRDTAYRSAANLDGNHRVIAIENEDATEWWKPLTPEQVQSNAKILRWAHETHGIPLQRCPDSRPNSRGLGFHRQGIDGNFGDHRFGGRVSGGETWTSSYGKVCPGDAKIAQLPEILALAQGKDDRPTTPEKDWFDMASKDDLRNIVRDELAPIRKDLDAIQAKVSDDATLEQARHIWKRLGDGLSALGVTPWTKDAEGK